MVLLRRLAPCFVAVCSVTLATLIVAAPAGATDDTYFDMQWGLAQIHAAEAWNTSTGKGVTIGIVDTGIEASHPDLASKIDATANCVGGTCREGSAADGHGHGTMVSGIAAAVTANGRGVAGVAPDARLVVAKAINDEGQGDVGDIINGIRWVVDHGARVVNLSLGDPNFLVTSLLGTPLRPAVEYAWSKGAIAVLASGNENVGLLDLGSSNYGNLNAVVVGATSKSGLQAGYSSPIGNAKWGIVAPGGSGNGPGEDILSTFLGGRYAWVGGTSMAAPHVSGALALLLAQGLTPTLAVQRLLATVDTSVRCGSTCAGRLNVAAAVAGGRSGGTLTQTPGPRSATAPTTATVVPPAAAASTTTAPGAATTTAPPPRPTESTTVHPEERALAAGVPSGSSTRSRNSAVLVLAVAVAATAWSVLGFAAWDRFRADAGW